MVLTLELASSILFFFNDTATTEIYTLSLHDALPIFVEPVDQRAGSAVAIAVEFRVRHAELAQDRKSTRLNSSHLVISYAVFCLKKKYITQISLHLPYSG